MTFSFLTPSCRPALMCLRALVLWGCLLGSCLAGLAQPRNSHWFFGNGIGLAFPGGGGPPVAGTGAAVVNEACSTISDAGGGLLFYTDGESVWDRTHALMPGACGPCGTGLGALATTTQGALIVRSPARAGQYYVFTLNMPPMPPGSLYQSLQYSLIDLGLRNGLGDGVAAVKNVPLLPAGPGGRLTEKLAGIEHRNRRDVWVVVHGHGTNTFYAYLVTAAGVSAQPVLSSVGSAHTDFTGPMKFSHDGATLAVNQVIVGVELFDFDPATGRVSTPRAQPAGPAWHYGVEFSPDDSRLYLFRLTQRSQLRQYKLRAGTLAEVVASAVDLPLQSMAQINYLGSLELGPDGKIYASQGPSSPHLGVVHQPNQLGAACAFQENGLALGGAWAASACRTSCGSCPRRCCA